MISIRHANENDMEAILQICNHEIIQGTAFWMVTPRTLNEQRTWFQSREEANLPVFVAVDEKQTIVGYGSYGPFRAYDGFRHTVEHSVYVTPSAHGKGVGTMLLKALITYAERSHVHAMIACITGGNMASIRLHEQAGFKHGGLLPEVGQKFGEWLDLVFMYKIIFHDPEEK